MVEDEAVELFDPPKSYRRFAPSDLLRLLVGVAIVGVGYVLARWGQSTIEGLEADVLRAFSRLPNPVEEVSLAAAQLLVSVLPAITLVVLLVKRRFRIALLLLLASACATVAMAGADSLVFDDRLRDVVGDLLADDEEFNPDTFPDSNTIASTVAVVIVAAPWLSKRWRQMLWVSIGLLAVLRLLAVDAPALDLVLALGVGTVVGSLTLWVFGSPIADPRPDELLA